MQSSLKGKAIGTSMLNLKFFTTTPQDCYKVGSSIIVGKFLTPWGTVYVGISAGCVCSLTFLEPPFALAESQLDNSAVQPYWEAIWNQWAQSQSLGFPFPLLLKGTDFRQTVWKGLLQIPRGTTVSYQAFAEQVGYPTAVRAVATAVGKNPISFFIPCHRVISKTGNIGKYRWGPALKKQLLEAESSPL